MKAISSARTTKRSIDELAIFGGQPLFAEVLHVGRPNIGDRQRFAARVDDIFDRRWLTNNGHYEQELEQRIAELTGVKHCIAMCNGTIGLEIAIRALEMKGEVIVPSFTFVATAHALQWQQIVPVFCDIDPATHNIDPRRVEELITPRTSGIIGVHVWGRACDTDTLTEIAQRHKLRLIFDAAHAFACSFKGQMIGGFGDLEVFSFHATKFFNTFEGGAVVTNDEQLAARIRRMKNFGFTDYDQTDCIGINGKMNEVSAAMGLTNLESLDEFIAINKTNYHNYKTVLAEIPGLSIIDYPVGERHNYHYVIIEVDENLTGITRDGLVKLLHAENILARRYFFPGCHQMRPYRSIFPLRGLRLPFTESLAERVVSLPNGTAIGPLEVEKICEIIRLAVSYGNLISERLRQAELATERLIGSNAGTAL